MSASDVDSEPYSSSELSDDVAEYLKRHSVRQGEMEYELEALVSHGVGGMRKRSGGPDAEGGRGDGGDGGDRGESDGGDGTWRNHPLRRDAGSVALLLLLYTLQGIPMGLSASVPLIMQERGVGYNAQASFSRVSWPFAIKLLWAPIVDAAYLPSVGRRKTWLVPVQLLTGAIMLAFGTKANEMLGAVGVGGLSEGSEDGSAVAMDVEGLTWLFMVLFFLMATQDIAVDGWALTMLSEENVGYQSSCNAIGQTLGYITSYIVFMAFNNAEFSNRFRAEPAEEGLISLGGFMRFWGGVFIATTAYVWLFKNERPAAAKDVPPRVSEAYGQMWQVMRLGPVLRLLLVLLTVKVSFAPADAISSLKLIEKGVPKETLALLGVAVSPVSLVLPAIISRFTGGPRPLRVYLAAIPPRLILSLVFPAFIWSLGGEGAAAGDGEDGVEGGATQHSISFNAYAFIVVCFVLHQITMNAMFVACMAFYARVSDPVIGGTYMTLLNTVTNIGGQWPNYVALKLMALVQVEGIDTYYLLCAAGFIYGVVWFLAFAPKVRDLGEVPVTQWHVSPRAETVA